MVLIESIQELVAEKRRLQEVKLQSDRYKEFIMYNINNPNGLASKERFRARYREECIANAELEQLIANLDARIAVLSI